MNFNLLLSLSEDDPGDSVKGPLANYGDSSKYDHSDIYQTVNKLNFELNTTYFSL